MNVMGVWNGHWAYIIDLGCGSPHRALSLQ